ncbi:MAG: hypothetical protein K6F49_09730 [Saccharofermentans sp.]|nr:hypothetical protein [Saccharofermentans sp.]
MLKRFVGTKSGKKQNKSGVILVTILFILAVAFILIGAALMMTANTRKRLYSFAEGGQARITCTAAAQLFQTALEEQQIRDSVFKDLCDAGTTVYFTDATVPGMGGAESANPNNYTKARFGKSGSLYTVRITTRIGDEVENILLTYQGTIPTVTPSPFAFQVELGRGGRMDNVKIGGNMAATASVDAEDNIIVTRGDGSAPNGSCDFFSTFVTTTPMRSASGTHYYRDLVFAGDTSGVDMTAGGGTGSGATMSGHGTVFFIDSDKIVWGTPTTAQTHEMFTGSSGSQIIFCNVDGMGSQIEQGFTGWDDQSIYGINYDYSTSTATSRTSFGFQGGSTTIFNGGTGYGASAATGKTLEYYIGNLEQYKDPNYVDPSTGVARPSSFAEFNAPIASGGYHEIIRANDNGRPDHTGVPELQPGDNTGTEYTIHGTISQEYRVNCSENNVVIYVTGNLEFVAGGKIIVDGGNGTATGSRCYIILAKDCAIDFNSNGTDCGIFSQNVVNATGGIDQAQAPCTYVIGAGMSAAQGRDAHTNHKGQISFNTSGDGTLQAMIALYPSADGADDAGDLYVYEGSTHTKIYGRIIAHTIWAENGGHLAIPYCPQFSSGENHDALFQVTTNFKLKDFDYYYDDGSTHVLESAAPSST